ncbi:MAG: flagellum-specific ATP synthase FliI [SAR116 cluster bacterium]|nr:flagellum-specific ATP synthase FliI [SAR116 cluster bacterium]RPH08121.1 MAG: FliI/YscN family ATPase [Alphaproteobacteria bacterium TMED54]
MNFTLNISEKIRSITFEKNIIHIGEVKKFDGNIIYADPFPAPIGSLCLIKDCDQNEIISEVIGFDENYNMLAVLGQNPNLIIGCKVKLIDDGKNINVDENILGRVTDAFGEPLDDEPLHYMKDNWPLVGKVMNPLKRKPVTKPLDVGIKVINSLLTIGQGQRIGIVAGSGVGKSILIKMMSQFTTADVVVIGLIGERAREVGVMVQSLFNDENKSKITVVAVPADRSPLMRVRGANRATAIAEYFRSKNKNVLLIMDSLTRIAHAKREIGLSLGEQPTSKGYPPSVISMIPNLIERTGNSDTSEGSITAFYTVLADADDHNDPVVDTSRAILDGHILLSRNNAQMGMYPAVDITNSVSRVMNDIINPEHLDVASKFRAHVSSYIENKDLIMMGGYVQGKDKILDEAILMWPKIIDFIAQKEDEKIDYNECLSRLLKLYNE